MINHILSDLVKIVREIIKSNIYIIDNLFADTRANVINFNRFIISVINIYNYFYFNFL